MLQERIYQCEFCLKIDAAYLECDHFYCTNCIIAHVKAASLNQPVNNLFCPSCNQEISPQFAESFLITSQGLQKLLISIKTCSKCRKPSINLVQGPDNSRICLVCLSKDKDQKNQAKNLEKQPNNKNPAKNAEKQPKNEPIKPNPPQKSPLQAAPEGLCSSCNKKSNLATICPHPYCLKCLNQLARRSITRDPFQLVKCEKCAKEFPDQLISTTFETPQSYQVFKNDCANALFSSAMFDCGICMTKTKIEEGITFNCDHRFCTGCVKEYFRERILSSNVAEDELVCPNCNVAIDHNIIQGVVDRDLYEKYVNFAFRNWKPEEGDILKYCQFCNTGTEIPANMKRFTCPQCKKTYCPQCNQDHSTKLTCDQYVKKLEDDARREEEEKIRKEVWAEEERLRKEQRIERQKNEAKNRENRPKDKSPVVRREVEENKVRANKVEEEKKKRMIKAEEEKNKKIQGKKNEDNYLEELKKESKSCPKCKNFVLRDSGCNFIKCRWPGCKDSYFCYLCGCALTVHHHYSHYKVSGPFGKTCNKMDGIKDE